MVTPKLAVASVVGVAVQFGLAVLGWGDAADFFCRPAFLALIAVTAVATIASFFTSANLSAGESEPRNNRWVLPAFAVLSLLLAYMPAWTDRADLWVIDGNATRWVGVALFAIGCVLQLWPVFVLGHRFSGLASIQRDHRLVTDGLYGVIRHPSYVGLLLTALGWALVFRSGVGVLITALIIVPTVARIRAEEALLSARFGAEYEAYRARTARLIPGIW